MELIFLFWEFWDLELIPNLMANLLYLGTLIVLFFMPILTIPAAISLGKEWLKDNIKPRNVFIHRSFMSSLVNAISSVFITLLTGRFLWELLQGERALEADFAGFVFIITIIALLIQPVLNWWSLKRIGNHNNNNNHI